MREVADVLWTGPADGWVGKGWGKCKKYGTDPIAFHCLPPGILHGGRFHALMPPRISNRQVLLVFTQALTERAGISWVEVIVGVKKGGHKAGFGGQDSGLNWL